MLLIIDKCRSQLGRVLKAIDQYFLEIQNSTLSVVTGIWFFVYPYDVHAYPGTFQYLNVAPLYIWGSAYFIFGVLHLLCLTSKYGFRKIRRQIMLIKSGLWAFLAITILLANPFSLIGYFAIVFMIMTFIAFLKVQILTESELHISYTANK